MYVRQSNFQSFLHCMPFFKVLTTIHGTGRFAVDQKLPTVDEVRTIRLHKVYLIVFFIRFFPDFQRYKDSVAYNALLLSVNPMESSHMGHISFKTPLSPFHLFSASLCSWYQLKTANLVSLSVASCLFRFPCKFHLNACEDGVSQTTPLPCLDLRLNFFLRYCFPLSFHTASMGSFSEIANM